MYATCTLLLSVIVVSTANSINLGQRRKGDFLLEEGTIAKSALPLTRREYKLTVGVNSVVINAIQVTEKTNDPRSNVRISITEGGIGSSKVQLTIKGQRGEGMNVDYAIYAYTPRVPEETNSTEFMGSLTSFDDDLSYLLNDTNNNFER